MRLLYYPPVPPEDDGPCCQRNGDVYTRCGAHADYGTFTLLAQDSEGGLEVRRKSHIRFGWFMWSDTLFKLVYITCGNSGITDAP